MQQAEIFMSRPYRWSVCSISPSSAGWPAKFTNF